ncbi:MAG: MarR family winged helix-turn-helix transcriptional regulator [Pseudodesulfovibrio sp.]|uniref:Regulatory protein MarR n=1 Tax=Pseudodesulfovibrio aespoeensis (strain ATCC 700646 / DSM 10631 / Aspo-2) TaxID=643562 RepID=E6VYU6_PSEA9|nr:MULTISPECIES: MarR family winged helix-turn-helix transcriptional regulator [Pseudodesulfovibrio]MBU4474476.1 MarR family winged helix-turn-helix transcriptional regulator [Pseudomonadota bacterium]ADU61609.1 regulatory protein MarR [Pseudodesulfovibrio aespoeensis Aspo-2]MBU4516073.1 MarR family winged helix-turn-helix transcriptional regulator [Pseudomonadota bacterium]MBU4521943.1 MarR family winged helix-turn-helix transcriptional regulator [Pseudomonadota bacterium]MBU4558371.1 MarR fa
MNSIIEKYMLLVEKISNTTKAHKSFGTDVNIYRSEIHIIQLIGDRGEVFISEIARLIGVTKGTVSQIVSRLEAKGLAEKSVDKNNNTRQLVCLTIKGMTAYQTHVNYHLRKHQEMECFLVSLNAENRMVLEKFLTTAHEMIEDHQ